MSLTLEPHAPPLRMDATGTVRVGGTRVTLDTLVNFHLQGYSPERLQDAFPTVQLADVYAAIGYYLKNKAEVEAYMAERERQGEEMRRKFEAEFPPRPIRPELLEKLRAVREAHEAAEARGTDERTGRDAEGGQSR